MLRSHVNAHRDSVTHDLTFCSSSTRQGHIAQARQRNAKFFRLLRELLLFHIPLHILTTDYTHNVIHSRCLTQRLPLASRSRTTRNGSLLPQSTAPHLITDGKSSRTKFEKNEFKLKPFEDRDIDIAIDVCGVCASDVHTITGGWGDAPLPLCVGHEVVGKAIRVGKDVKTVKVGDRVGVGAQIQADLTCANCKADQENYCPNAVDTYGAPYKDGTLSQGGYASHIRAHEYFTFKIPDNIESAIAAPMM